MKIKDLKNIKSLFQGKLTPIELTIKIDLTFVKRLSEILVSELNKLGVKLELDTSIKIITKILNEYVKKHGDRDSKD